MNLDSYPFFCGNKKTLQYTSRDTSRNPIQFMTTDTRKVVDFDDVKKDFLAKMFKISYKASRSADALLSARNGLFLIEFKNGEFMGIEIAQKANNSILLFNCITSKQIDYTRKNVSFVLVYNKANKKMTYEQAIALHKARCAKVGLASFGTDKLKGFSFKDVYMIEKDEFEDFSRNILI